MRDALEKAGLLFWSPARLFGELRERWPWSTPYLLAVICGMAGTVVSLFALRGSLDAGLRQINSELDISAWTTATLLVGTLIGAFVSPLLIAFLYSFVAAFAGLCFGRYPDYGKLFSLTMWCLLPNLTAGTLIRALLVLAHPSLISELSLSPAGFLPDHYRDTALYAVLSTFDVFQVYFYVLMAIGYSVITSLTIQRSAVISALLYAGQLLITLAFRG